MKNVNVVDETLVDICEAVIRGAGRKLVECAGNVDVLEDGGENRSDFTTTADMKSLKYIVNILKKTYPEKGILAEGLEKAELSIEIDDKKKHPSKDGLYWVIDPLCGTIMHKKGIRDYIISLALVDEEPKIFLGMVYDPSHDELFCAVKGLGAYMNDKIIKVADTDTIDQTLVSIEHRIIRQQGDKMTPIITDMKRLRTAGTCGLELSYTASGHIDFLMKAEQPLYDYAAGILILQEAGGHVTDFQGNKIKTELSYRDITHFIGSNGKVHDKILEYTAGMYIPVEVKNENI